MSQSAAILKPRLTLRFDAVTNVGGRANNEDAYRICVCDARACFTVSDGVGGENGGEIASQAIVNTVTTLFAQQEDASDATLLACLDAAKAEVARLQATDAALEKMSATVAMLLLDCERGEAQWGHLGDSRIYQFRDQKICRVTKDHSAVQQLVEAGYCSADQLRTHPLRCSLLGAIGAPEGEGAEAVQETSEFASGDAFLLCTDGFWEWIEEHQMEAALQEAASVEQWLDELEKIADERSHSSHAPRDNYTAIAIWIENPAPPSD
ncbi:protein phosphatase 2C domain-containing protein [Noviherbaspirillum agri]